MVDVERIYFYKPESTQACHIVLIILIANSCGNSPNELLPPVNSLIEDQHAIYLRLHAAHQAKEAMSQGNLYFYNICTEDKLIYRKPESMYNLLSESLNIMQMLENARKQYDLDEDKVKASISGADFYLEKANYALSAFMLHQAIEFTYRAIEHFATGKTKITHSIKAHQKYLEPYCTELSNIF